MKKYFLLSTVLSMLLFIPSISAQSIDMANNTKKIDLQNMLRNKTENKLNHYNEIKKLIFQLTHNCKSQINSNRTSAYGFRPIIAIIDDSTTYYYDYNDTGNLKSVLIRNFENNKWNNSTRLSYTYNQFGNKISSLEESWKDSIWVNLNRFTYVYDDSGREISMLDENWYDNNWENDFRFIRTYDEKGNSSSSLFQQWESDAWQNIEKYIYENRAHLLNIIHQIWQDNIWLNDYKSLFSWTDYADSSIFVQLSSSWKDNCWKDEGRNTWFQNFEQKKMVIVSELLTDTGWIYTKRQTQVSGTQNDSSLIEVWENNAWMNLERQTTKNTNNSTIQLSEKWVNNAWQNDSRTSGTYTMLGYKVSDISEEWRNNKWEYISKYTYRYDQYGNHIYSDYFLWQNNFWIEAKGGLYFDDRYGVNSLGFWGKVARVYYSEILSARDINGPITGFNLSQNYPNPFNPSTNIKYSIPKEGRVNLTVYNVLGQKIKELINETKPAGTYEIIFNTNSLSSGLYFYRLQAGELLETKKMLFEK